jgi:hypothetical protein
MTKIVPKEVGMMNRTLSPSASENAPQYPMFRIELQHLPEAKKWEVGKEYQVTLDLKMVGKSISRLQNDAEFEIHGIEVENAAEDAAEGGKEESDAESAVEDKSEGSEE